jgi:hypothetical protein
MAVQVVKEFLAFSEIPTFIAVFEKALHWTIS